MKTDFLLPSPINKVSGIDFGFELYVKREDLIHKEISGNKYRKLKYNLEHFKEYKYSGIVSFGGAYSNHLHALAALCKIENIPSVGIIRGEYDAHNPTLQFAADCGMKLYFVSREDYRFKEKSNDIQNIINQYPNYMLIPEGGSNNYALTGVKEIIDEINDVSEAFDYIAVSAGTGCTASGILKGIKDNQLKTKLIVFSALKGQFLKNVIAQQAQHNEFHFTDEYCFGGFAKINEELMEFIKNFEKTTTIPLDYVYNGKLVYGLKNLGDKRFFKSEEKVLWIHTGGLQGNYKR